MAFLLRFIGCLWAVLALLAFEGFAAARTVGMALLLALYGTAALQCLSKADRIEKRKEK